VEFDRVLACNLDAECSLSILKAQPDPVHGIPPSRIYPATVVVPTADPSVHHFYLLGGSRMNESRQDLLLDDIWRLTLCGGEEAPWWHRLDIKLEVPVCQATAVWHQASSSIFVFGGVAHGGPYSPPSYFAENKNHPPKEFTNKLQRIKINDF
jgi:hypothetical protein